MAQNSNWRVDYAKYKKIFLDIYRIYNQKPELRAFLEVILTLTAISILGAFALRPTILTIIDLTKQIEAKKEVIDKMDQKIANTKVAQENYSLDEAQIGLLESAVPDGPSPEGLVRQMEGLANSEGVTILGSSISDIYLVGKPEKEKSNTDKDLTAFPSGVKDMKFTITISGGYLDTKRFIEHLEFLRRPVKLDSINMTAQKSNSDNLITVLTGRVPYIETNQNGQ